MLRLLPLLLVLVLPGCSMFRKTPPPSLVLTPLVSFAEGVNADSASLGCDWALGMAGDVQRFSKGAVQWGDASATQERHVLSLEVRRFEVSIDGGEREYVIAVRANVRHRGKLVSSFDYSREVSANRDQPVCPVLQKAARRIAAEIEDWTYNMRFASCAERCQDIHPDEPIVIAPTPLLASPLAVNDGMSPGECDWQSFMVAQIDRRYSGGRPAPTAPLRIQPVDITAYEGRKLIVVVDKVYVTGGARFTGPKHMILHGALVDHGFTVANFTWEREELGSYGACRTVRNMSEDAAEFIAQWLQRPIMDASSRRVLAPLWWLL